MFREIMEEAAAVSTSLFIGQPLTEIVEYSSDVDEDSTNTLYSQSSFEFEILKG